MDLLITLDDINELARPCRCDPHLFERCCDEAQSLDIINDIGTDIFLKLFDEEQPHEIKKLWNGGIYTSTAGKRKMFDGLKKALCYYTFARICRASGNNVTRFDVVTKREDYSDSANTSKRSMLINDVLACADSYKLGAIEFIKNSGFFPCANVQITNNRVRVRMLGK